MAHEFGDFEIAVTTKPQPGAVTGEIPEKLAAHLEKSYKAALEADKELTLKAASEKDAKLLAGYAKAWGARQDPKLRITKIANRQGMPDNVARLNVQLESDVAAENRPGRPKAK